MFKFNGELIREAHRLTKEIKREYPEVTYSFQFGLTMKYLLSDIKGVEKIMVELKGSEKQIKWAKDIRKDFSNWVDSVMTDDVVFKRYCMNIVVMREDMGKIRDYALNNIEDASYWIRHTPQFIFRTMAKKARKKLHLKSSFGEYNE